MNTTKAEPKFRIVWESDIPTCIGVEPNLQWSEIPWKQVEKRVYKLQKRIYQASSRGDVKTVRGLQRLLMKSWSAKTLAVRRISQDNQGKNTAGVDGVKSLTPKQRINLVTRLKIGIKVKPTRRVWIPKPGSEEKRPLGIPTIQERALQSLVKLGLEPEWEAHFEPNSYGFRPGRSCQDAVSAIFQAITHKAKFVLDADIAKCFDRINHEQLLRKLNTFPTLRRQIRAWLKAGVMDGKELFPTDEGTPQGGCISPLLANIALHGMEERIKTLAETFDMKYHNRNKQIPKRDKRSSVSLIRYADDFVIIHEDVNAVHKCKEVISEFLLNMGLELKPSKTRLVHTLHEIDGEKPGFDFLGFNIRQYKVGKYNSAKNGHGKILGYKTIIKPSKASTKQHYYKLKKVIEKSRGLSQAELIRILNPIIRGYCNYFKAVSSSKIFQKLESLVFWKLWKWATCRHPNKGKRWIKQKYWQSIGNENWAFSTRGEVNPQKLFKHSEMKIVDYVKVKGDSSPYDGNLIYWSARLGQNPEMPTRVAKLLKKQKGKCPHCGLVFKDGDVMEIDHIVPKAKGGKDTYENFQLLHRHCHDEKTALDGKFGK